MLFKKFQRNEAKLDLRDTPVLSLSLELTIVVPSKTCPLKALAAATEGMEKALEPFSFKPARKPQQESIKDELAPRR